MINDIFETATCISHVQNDDKFFAIAIGKNDLNVWQVNDVATGSNWNAWVKTLRKYDFTVAFDDIEIASLLQCSIIAIAPGHTKEEAIKADNWFWTTILMKGQ